MLLKRLDQLWFSTPGERVRAAFGDAVDVLAPSWCVGCAAPGTELCPPCSADCRRLSRAPFRAEGPAEALPLMPCLHPLPVLSALKYTGLAADVILAFKEQERVGLSRVLAPALSRSLEAAMTLCPPDPLLVWPPASLRSMVVRGRHPLRELIDCAHGSRRLQPAGHMVRVPRAASAMLPSQRSQKGRSQAGRRSKAVRYELIPGARRMLQGTPVLLCDDVVTTGSTMRRLYDLLTDAGAEVYAAAVLAAAPRSDTVE